MTDHPRNVSRPKTLGVAETKRRFSELIERVAAGESFVVSRRGKTAVAIVPPSAAAAQPSPGPPVGLAAVAGALADWDDLDEVVRDVYKTRRRSSDRPAPELG